MLISGVDITVLHDSGATVSAMDEATFMRCGLDKCVKLKKKSRCQIKTYGSSTETHLLPMLGSFEALTESKRKMKVVTWQLIKGNTQAAQLRGWKRPRNDTRGQLDFRGKQAKLKRTVEGSGNVNKLLEEYKDRFEGIGKLESVQVDLNVDPGFEPIAQPPRQRLS